MAKFLTTQGVSYELENIIKNAKSRLVLISPYVDVSKPLLQLLRDTDRRKVETTLVYGKKQLEAEVHYELRQLDNLSLYFLENLHAKCFYNEESMVITSLNLLDSSRDNREMGVLLSRDADKDCFQEAVREANLIVNSSEHIVVRGAPTHEKSKRAYFYEATATGYCIRCKKALPMNQGKPLCRDCYDGWAEWGNPDHEEKFCHSCGKPASTTMAKPLCHSCYKKLFG